MDSSKMGRAWGKLGWKARKQMFKSEEDKSEYFRQLVFRRHHGTAAPVAHKKCEACTKAGYIWKVVKGGKCSYRKHKKNGKLKRKNKKSK